VRPIAFVVTGLGLGCGGSSQQAAPRTDSTAAVAGAPVAPTPADSLVLTTGSGHQIWLTEGRTASGDSGRVCYERSVEIRHQASRIKIPLLFVTKAPTSFDAGHVSAELSLDCRPLALYRIELATGRPIKIRDLR
jgi:hypothetical protein